MTPSDDPHLVERLARLAAFHELPPPVVVQMTLMAAELLQRPVASVYEEVQARIAASGAARTPQRHHLKLVR